MQSKLSVLALLLLCGALVGCRAPRFSSAAADQSPVIVQINGAAERQAAFERFVKARLSDFAQGVSSQRDNDQLRSRLLDEFIRRQLIVQQAAQKKVAPTADEIRTALEALHRQTSSSAAGQNQTSLESSERRAEIFNDLLTLKFYKTEALKDVQITTSEIEAYYQQHRAQYQGQDGFYVREIRTHEAAAAEQAHRQAVAKPQDFPVLAREYSEAPTATNGGLIYYEAQQLPAPLEQAITPLKVGAISAVVKSSYGFHIFKLEQRAEPLPLEKVRQEIEDKLLSVKNQKLIDEYNRRALGSAKIIVHRDRLGFNYMGQFGA